MEAGRPRGGRRARRSFFKGPGSQQELVRALEPFSESPGKLKAPEREEAVELAGPQELVPTMRTGSAHGLYPQRCTCPSGGDGSAA